MTSKSIDDLLEEFGDPPFTADDFVREKWVLMARFELEHALNDEDQINEAIRTYRLPCTNTLVEQWVDLMAFKPYL